MNEHEVPDMTKQKAIVAASPIGTGNATIVWATPGVIFDCKEAGIDATDAWPEEQLPKAGFLVWEGNLVNVGYCDYGDGDDVEYEGAWRDLNEDEWALLRELSKQGGGD